MLTMDSTENIFFTQTVQMLMKESGFDRATSEEILRIFCKQASGQLAEVKTLLAHNNFEQIARIMHTFKGGAGTARVKEMAQYASEAEEAAKSGQVELLGGLVETLENLLGVLDSKKKSEKD